MGMVEAAEAAKEGLGEEASALWKRFEGVLHRFEPGCDADAVAREATAIRFEAGEAAEAIEELRESLEERLSFLRGLDEKSERLADDAHARYYGP